MFGSLTSCCLPWPQAKALSCEDLEVSASKMLDNHVYKKTPSFLVSDLLHLAMLMLRISLQIL